MGIVLREDDFSAHGRALAALTDAAARAGVDHLTVGDHVSFSHGRGTDGLVQAAMLLASHPTLPVQTGVYLLALRHPAPVARQLATIDAVAPGRLTFGVGVGGDDRRELELCGVDPRTRGARTTEALTLLRRFMTGEEVTFEGRFFRVRQAAIRPALDPPPPILVGGRSDAAHVRTGRLGDGWLSLWVSPRRYAEGVETVRRVAHEAGRGDVAWLHTLQMWTGLDSSRERAVARLRPVIEQSYGLPFDRFERYCPCGTPADVATALEPYLAVGCRRFNFVCEAPGLEGAIEAIGEVKALLARVASGAAGAPAARGSSAG